MCTPNKLHNPEPTMSNKIVCGGDRLSSCTELPIVSKNPFTPVQTAERWYNPKDFIGNVETKNEISHVSHLMYAIQADVQRLEKMH